MLPSRTNPTQLRQRLAVFATVAVAVVVGLSGGSVDAGVILPWVSDSSASGLDFASDGCGASSDPELPVDSDHSSGSRDDGQDCKSLVAGLVKTGGGASVPVNHVSGQGSLLVAAMCQSPPVSPLMLCASRIMRERFLKLPHPPLDELLDPPKSRA